MTLTDQEIRTDERAKAEYNLVIDGVIELKADTDTKKFFDDLFDAIIAYVEENRALAGLIMNHKEINEGDGELENGGEGT